MKDRASMYKEPMRFMDNNLFESDTLSAMQLEQWEAFDATPKDAGFKIGDFIDVAVRTSANQVAKFMEELQELETVEEVRARITEVLKEVYIEIKE